MNNHTTRRVAVVVDPLLRHERFDYADAYEVVMSDRDERSSAQFAQDAFERAPGALQTLVAAGVIGSLEAPRCLRPG